MSKNNTLPCISVIMAVYNTEHYLKEAIESILTQTFSDFELVIVDDGSTDHCPQILQGLCQLDARIKIITQKNAGIGAATQRAISESCGQYIAIMDSDDISLPHRLSLQKEYLDQHPKIDAVGSQWRMLNTLGENAGIDTHPVDPKTIGVLMYAYFSLHHPTTMIRRNAIDKINGYSTDRTCLVPDYDLFMRLQLNGCQFANIPIVLFIWRLNPTSTTRSKATQQATSVFQVKEQGFASLLKEHPETAKSISQLIIYNFPTGTWQDHKIQQLTPEPSDSLLYKTWLSLPTTTLEEQLFRTLVLWLREPIQQSSLLSTQLHTYQKPWLASLVNAHIGKGSTLSILPFSLPASPVLEKSCLITLFIPFVNSKSDFSQRLKQAQQLQLHSDLSIELLVFSASEQGIPENLVTDNQQSPNLTIHTAPFSWEVALKSAQGQYFIYLEENHRFHIKKILPLLHSITSNKVNILYMLDIRYFTEAMDESGHPILDEAPSPIWTRRTLLGKDRLALTGFIHQRSLFNDIHIKLDECGQLVSRALARHLAIHHSFIIHQGCVNYFIPATTLNNTPLLSFQQTILDWFVDFGETQLPIVDGWGDLSDNEINKYAHALSDAWLKSNLFLFSGNESIIKLFYINKVSKPIDFPLFRHLLVHNKKMILASLWQKKKTILLFSASFICITTIFTNRFSALLNRK